MVEIGAELLAIAASCTRAHQVAQRDEERHDAIALADLFSNQARRRVAERFDAIWSNDDVQTYGIAQDIINDRMTWLERGIVQES
jgi:hypothetical protein